MQSGSDMGDGGGEGSDGGTVDIINHVVEQDQQLHQLQQAAHHDHQHVLLGQPSVEHQHHHQHLQHAELQQADLQQGDEHDQMVHDDVHQLVHNEVHDEHTDPLGSLPLGHEQSVV